MHGYARDTSRQLTGAILKCMGMHKVHQRQLKTPTKSEKKWETEAHNTDIYNDQ